jgi:hypothetical protein
MAIDASVSYVELHEDGSGVLHLCDRIDDGRAKGLSGQPRLHFDDAPFEVTALNGLHVWGGATQLMLGDTAIATRIGYTKISFNERDVFLSAVAEYHRKRRSAADT